MVTVREVSGAELKTTAHLLQAYAFSAGPAPHPAPDAPVEDPEKRSGTTTLVAFDGDTPIAAVSAWPFVQNVRGAVVKCLGIAGVATHPGYRRGGHVRTLMNEQHRLGVEAGYPVAALYPFRPSFYAKFGYAGLPKPRRIKLNTAGMAELLGFDLPVKVELGRSGDAGIHEASMAVEQQWLEGRHGFIKDTLSWVDEGIKESDDRFVALCRRDGEPTGFWRFRTPGYSDVVQGDRMLVSDPVSRLALLKWLAGHADQFAGFEFELPPGEVVETWFTDVDHDDMSLTSVPGHNAPMARVLTLPGLAGMVAGPAALTVEVVGDNDFAGNLSGTFQLDGSSGALEVSEVPASSGDVASLSVRGLSGLIYCGQDPTEIASRGLGTFPGTTAEAATTLFPPVLPYLYRGF
jgi:Acetyltransferase (GNAT) domain